MREGEGQKDGEHIMRNGEVLIRDGTRLMREGVGLSVNIKNGLIRTRAEEGLIRPLQIKLKHIKRFKY